MVYRILGARGAGADGQPGVVLLLEGGGVCLHFAMLLGWRVD